MEINLIEVLTGNGIDITKIPEYLPKITAGIEMVKSKLPMIQEFEKTYNLKENELLIYSLIPAGNEILIKGFVVVENDKGETLITREVFSFKTFDQIDKILSTLPKM